MLRHYIFGDEGGIIMKKPKYGRFFEPFIPESESISSYLELAELYLRASGVRKERTVAVFLSAIGLTAYTVLRDLCRPDKIL